jgi:hypothetical protein
MCWGCGSPHIDFRCPLITNYNLYKTKISPEWQEIFDKKMSDQSFEKKVELIRDTNKARSDLLKSTEAKAEAKAGVEAGAKAGSEAEIESERE